MPTYEYQCNKCSKSVTEVRSITQSQEDDNCSDCDGKLYQVYGKMAISFKGDGFYTTDKKKRD